MKADTCGGHLLPILVSSRSLAVRDCSGELAEMLGGDVGHLAQGPTFDDSPNGIEVRDVSPRKLADEESPTEVMHQKAFLYQLLEALSERTSGYPKLGSYALFWESSPRGQRPFNDLGPYSCCNPACRTRCSAPRGVGF